MAEKNTPKEVTRGGGTLNQGWLVGQIIVQDVGDEGGSVEHPLSKNQTVAKLLTPPLRDNARVAAQDVAMTDGEGGGSVGHTSSKNHVVLKIPTPPLGDHARVAAQDVKGEATTDGEGGGPVGHSSSKNHSVVKLPTPPLRDYARVAAQDVKGEATTDGEGGGSVGHPSLENHTVAKFLTPPLQDNNEVAVVMVPLPAQGHLNQLLHLSRLISMYNIQVYYIGNTSHIQQAKIRAHVFDPLSITNIRFHEFHQTPSFETPMPNPNASFKYPNHLIPSFYATFHLREPVSLLVRELVTVNHRKVVVIYDSLMAFVVQDLPQIPNIECYCFNTSSAFFFYSYIWEFKGKPFHPGTENYEDIPTNVDCFPPEFWEFLKIQEQFDGKISCGELFNSSRVIESLYLDLMAKEYGGVKQWAIGPFNPMKPQEMSKDLNKRHESLDWLDKQERDSVIFVSFGTTTSLCDEEIKVLAIGLEKSRQKFVWVLRDADKGDIFTSEDRKVQLPQGYEERIKERGIIVRDWAPQLEILAHSSTGGFLSHCGWNSCMESMSCGVPIAAWPMHSDQPRNSQLVTNYLKIGLIVRPWTRRDEVVTSDIVENAVKTLMASPEGDEMRKRAADLSNAIKKSVTDGGINRESVCVGDICDGSTKSITQIIIPHSNTNLDDAISQVFMSNFRDEFEDQHDAVVKATSHKLQSVVTKEMSEVCVDLTLVFDHECDGRILIASAADGMMPASKSSIENLEPMEAHERNSKDDCAVCLDEFGEETQVLSMPCSHMFHAHCITKWLQKSHYCPLCRFAMPTE